MLDSTFDASTSSGRGSTARKLILFAELFLPSVMMDLLLFLLQVVMVAGRAAGDVAKGEGEDSGGVGAA